MPLTKLPPKNIMRLVGWMIVVVASSAVVVVGFGV